MSENTAEQNTTSASEVGDNELEKRAKEIAEETMKKGLGQLFGHNIFVVHKDLNFGWQDGPSFALGDEILEDKPTGTFHKLYETIPITHVDDKMTHDKSTSDEPKQVWVVENFTPPTRKWLTQVGGLFRKRYEEHEEIIDFKGKRGETGWTKYTYYMPTYDIDRRPGSYINLTVVVPPEVSKKIDEAAENDIYFPDRYFKVLFPGTIGQDQKIAMRRKKSSQLLVVDRREDPKNMQGELRDYPQPIEY